MTLQHLKNLSRKRIINMKGIYEKAGLSVTSMNSRISTMRGSLSQEEEQALELAVIEQLEEIVLTLEIPPSHLAHALNITAQSIQAKSDPSIPAVGYLETNGRPIPVFLPPDKIKIRKVRTGSAGEEFWEEERVINSIVNNRRFTPTDRGKDLMK